MNGYLNSRLYVATFENLKRDNKMFRAYNDFKAMERASKISDEHNYGRILHIYEIHPNTFKTKRVVFS